MRGSSSGGARSTPLPEDRRRGGLATPYGTRAFDRRQSGEGEDFVDPPPAVDRFALGEEVATSADGGGREGVEQLQMGRRGVLDVCDVDEVVAGTDLFELAASGTLQQTRDEVAVAGPQMRCGRIEAVWKTPGVLEP